MISSAMVLSLKRSMENTKEVLGGAIFIANDEKQRLMRKIINKKRGKKGKWKSKKNIRYWNCFIAVSQIMEEMWKKI